MCKPTDVVGRFEVVRSCRRDVIVDGLWMSVWSHGWSLGFWERGSCDELEFCFETMQWKAYREACGARVISHEWLSLSKV